MKVVYNDKHESYIVLIEPMETETCINTSDIVEARKIFIEHMNILFNRAICENSKDLF